MKFRKRVYGKVKQYSNVRNTKGVGRQTIVASIPKNTKLRILKRES